MKKPTIYKLLLCILVCMIHITGVFSQEVEFQKFSGTVIDSEGKLIRYAHIFIPGISRGTISDVEGRFSLMAKDKETIYCEYMGMKRTELQLDKNQSSGLVIRMEPEVYKVEEIRIDTTRYIYINNKGEFESHFNYIFERVEQDATFPGEKGELKRYLTRTHSLQYREEGQVTVEFTITKKGVVTNPKIVKSVSPSLDKEAIRMISSMDMISSMPRWIPATQRKRRARPIETQQSLSINFRIYVHYKFVQ